MKQYATLLTIGPFVDSAGCVPVKGAKGKIVRTKVEVLSTVSGWAMVRRRENSHPFTVLAENLTYAKPVSKKVPALPWQHHHPSRLMSAVLDAKGNFICGSLVCEQPNESRVAAHAFIVERVNGCNGSV